MKEYHPPSCNKVLVINYIICNNNNAMKECPPHCKMLVISSHHLL
jgi:hypothetical protein